MTFKVAVVQDSPVLFNLHSTLLSLKKRTEDELLLSSDVLKDDIINFKNNSQQKPTLQDINNLWEPVKMNILSNKYKSLIEIQNNSYPIFEEFIKYVVNTYENIKQIIEIISINLKNITLFMEKELTDFTFSNEISKVDEGSSINDKMNQLLKDIDIRKTSAKSINTEIKMEEINKLIEDRKKLIRELYDSLI